MLAGPLALASIGVVASKSAVRSALCLVFTFFVLSFLYFSLNMELMGISQVMVYAGAIMVLFVFVIMLLNPKHLDGKDLKLPIGLLFGLGLFTLIGSQVLPKLINNQVQPMVYEVGSPKYVGEALFTTYVFPFELVSLLLLVGVVGSIFLAKRRTP